MISNSKYKCIWYILDNSHRLLLGICYIIFGLVSLLLHIWLTAAFLQSPLLNSSRSHLLLLNLCISCLGRTVLAGFPFSGISALLGRWVFGEACCQLFGFLKQMLGIFQMTALTMIAIERYIISRRAHKADEPSYKFYISGIVSCWIISIAFAIPPLFHYGSYRCDITGIVCDLDWRMTNTAQSVFNVTTISLAGIVPIFIISWCLYQANRKEYQGRQTYAQNTLTKTIILIVIGMLLLWFPYAVLIFWIISGLGWSPRIFPVSLAMLAPLCSEVSTLIPVLCYLAYNERIRAALMNMIGSNLRTPRNLIR